MKSADLKQSGFAPMLKNVFKRNILFFIIAQLGSVFIAVLYTTSNLTKKPSIVMDVTSEISEEISAMLFILYIFMSLLIVYILFRELFSRRSSDFLLAMPVKRSAYFNASMLFGLICIAVSYVLAFATVAFVVKSNLFYPVEFFTFDLAVFARLMAVQLIASVAILAIFVMCASISGRKWHYFLLSYFAVSSVYSAAVGLSQYINSIWGFALDNDYKWIVSPIAGLFTDVTTDSVKLVWMCVAFAVHALLAYFAALIAFKRRKAEVAETSLFGKILPPALITILFIAEAFLALALTNSIYINIAVAVVAILILAVISCALFYRKAMNKLILKCIIISFVVAGAAVCSVQFLPGATGYTDYVPESSEVETVTVKCGGQYMDSGVFMLFKKMFYIDSGANVYSYQISDDEAKEAVYVLHNKMISKETIDRYYGSNMYDEVNSESGYVYDAENSIRLEYKLKNGKSVVRTYTVNASSVSKEFAALVRTDNFIDQIFEQDFNKDILFAELYDYHFDEDEQIMEEGGSTYLLLNEYNTLLDCIKTDIKSFSDERLLMLADGYDPEMYKSWDDDEIYNDVDQNDNTISITFYYFSESAPAGEKEKMLKMAPAEMIQYDSDYMPNYSYESLLSQNSISIEKNDKNTVSYLESQGCKLNFK